MEKINIAKLLKDCPKGMELYSTIYGTVYFEGVRDTGNAVLIDVKTSCNTEVQFYPDGKFNTYYSDSEMTLFPSKDVRNWNGFVPPCKFKDGDVIYVEGFRKWVAIVKSFDGNAIYEHAALLINDATLHFSNSIPLVRLIGIPTKIRFATETEKQKLFQVIKDNGYKWNAETKTLEKLIKPRFKVGDKIQDEDGYKVKITEVNLEDECYGYESIIAKGIGGIAFSEQDDWELVPNKFDITTLKPFDKVLYRMHRNDTWLAGFYNVCIRNNIFVIGSGAIPCCIPYEGNEHLLGTTDDCDEFYKTWE